MGGSWSAGGPEFLAALDYVGLDFFPDVFRPIPADRLVEVLDADSAREDPLYQLGLLRSDYVPKPAFEVYRDLIAEFTSPGTSARPV